MSYFSVALQRHAERHQFSQSDLARHSGISRSFICRLFQGEEQNLSDQYLVAILNTFAPDHQAQADLIAARCLDAREVARAARIPGATLVQVLVKHAGSTEEETTEPPQVHLSRETERAFAWLHSQCPINPELEKHLVGYARLAGMA